MLPIKVNKIEEPSAAEPTTLNNRRLVGDW